MQTQENNYKSLTYLLITPTRNEAAFIEQTIISVINQTIRPVRWIIVNDGSTDETDTIVQKYTAQHSWIRLIQMPPRIERHFGGKAIAFNEGCKQIVDISYDVIGNLDADITFDPGYFEFLLKKFNENQNLGVAGTPFREGNRQYDYRFSRKDHVSGACQLFRRECFESIGGYVPMKGGGIDLVAVVTARMKGWTSQTFTEIVCFHHRSMGKAGSHFVKYTFRSGYGDYLLGVHLLWQVLRSFYQMSRKPFFISGFLLLIGYVWGMLTRPVRPVSEEFVRFRKKEQMQLLKLYLRKSSSREKNDSKTN